MSEKDKIMCEFWDFLINNNKENKRKIEENLIEFKEINIQYLRLVRQYC